jgi:hypothetical protein
MIINLIILQRRSGIRIRPSLYLSLVNLLFNILHVCFQLILMSKTLIFRAKNFGFPVLNRLRILSHFIISVVNILVCLY